MGFAEDYYEVAPKWLLPVLLVTCIIFRHTPLWLNCSDFHEKYTGTTVFAHFLKPTPKLFSCKILTVTELNFFVGNYPILCFWLFGNLHPGA